MKTYVMKIETTKTETAQKCTFCELPPVQHDGIIINPPVCAVHEDLLLLVESMERNGLPVTVEIVQQELAIFRANGGGWTITPADIPQILPAFLEKRGGTNGP